MEQETAVQAQSWMSSLKEYLSPVAVIDSIRVHKDVLIEYGMYASFGFLIGFFFKRDTKYVLVVALCIIGIIVLNHFDLITFVINWDKLRELFGMQITSPQGADSIANTIIEWIKANVGISVSFILGFILGMKVG